MWECTILRKSFQSAPATTPKKEQDKDDEEDKKDRDGFQQQQKRRQRHIWRRFHLLQASSEAHTQRDPLNRANNSEATQI